VNEFALASRAESRTEAGSGPVAGSTPDTYDEIIDQFSMYPDSNSPRQTTTQNDLTSGNARRLYFLAQALPTGHTDLRKKTPKPAPEVLARQIRIELDQPRTIKPIAAFTGISAGPDSWR
jgi:hypothetical protein